VVYEENLGASPRRKVRTGDRVTASQGLVTLPEVKRMLVEATVPEAEVHRLRAGQPATITLDAFPGLRLTGKVGPVGTLARSSLERPFEEKRFDVVVEVDAGAGDLRPEMTARVDIVVSERQGVLLVPVNAVFERHGLPVCHVLRPLGTETRQVQLGETDDVMAEVVAGLQEGDRVVLSDVTAGQVAPTAVTPQGGEPSRGGLQGGRLAPR
jgi:multidrug efflux pump subunit AcrA (membrane-fusion protein)